MTESSCLERLARPLWLLYTWRAVQVIDRGVDLVGSIFNGVAASFGTSSIAGRNRITYGHEDGDVYQFESDWVVELPLFFLCYRRLVFFFFYSLFSFFFLRMHQ